MCFWKVLTSFVCDFKSDSNMAYLGNNKFLFVKCGIRADNCQSLFITVFSIVGEPDLGVSKPWRNMFMMRNIPGTPMSYFFRSRSLLLIVRVVNQKEKTQWPRGARVADAQLVDRYPRQRRMRRDSKAEGKGIQVEGEEEGMGIQVPAGRPYFQYF